LADHVSIAKRRGEDVEAFGSGRRYRWLAQTVRSAQGESASADGARLSDIVIQETGLDGFWIHRMLQSKGIESHVVDAASILTSRRGRRAKTDRIDGETLVRSLMAFKRGEPRVCSMARAPTPQEEDRRRVCRERRTLVGERVSHVNRIKGLLFAQAVFGYQPLRKGRREQLEQLRTGDGRSLPVHLMAQIVRELDRLEVVLEQLKTVEAERNALLKPATGAAASPPTMLLELKGIGPETAAVLWSEGLFRQFDNRRQVAAYAGLVPTPWQSGSIDHEQGVSKAGNRRLRTTMVELAWLWLQNQPTSGSACGSTSGSGALAGGCARRPSSPWRASCSSPCGGTRPPASSSRGP
jgi:transposase